MNCRSFISVLKNDICVKISSALDISRQILYNNLLGTEKSAHPYNRRAKGLTRLFRDILF